MYGGTTHPRILYLFYASTETMFKEITLLMTFTDFVAASGGNMGLFLGLSVVSMLVQIIGVVERLFTARGRDRETQF